MGPPVVLAGARIRGCRKIRLDVAPDEYTFAIGLAWIDQADADMRDTLPYAALAERLETLLVVKDAAACVVQFRSQGQALPFHGIANLDGHTAVWVS